MTEAPSDDEQPGGGPPARGGAAPLDDLRAELLAAAGELGVAGVAGAIALERPRKSTFGDYSTNAAMVLAQSAGSPPRELAERLGAALAERLGASLERHEVAGPGFINLFLADSWLTDALAQVLRLGERFGAGTAPERERVIVEFVSANPTGPMHVGHARNAAYGDSVARMLSLRGHDVAREFYVNDGGSQVRKFGESIAAVARGGEVPEDGYQGDYIGALAAELPRAATAPVEELGHSGVAVMVDRMRATLERLRVLPFDRWAYESALFEGDPSPVARVLAKLADAGHTYEQDGALWLRTTDFGDDKDRVLMRSSGEHTYFASDIAYHQDKRERGFERQLDVWGADHHGYVQRMKAAYAALGGDPGELELLIMQFVHLLSGGERAQMSKRAGEFVTVEDLIDEIGVDATRWYLLARSHDTTVEVDLALAREQSNDNPVYYVQYAHARIASMLVRASGGAGGADGGQTPAGEAEAAARGPGQPLDPSERALIEMLLAFPGELAEASDRRAPHRLATYALELAQSFTAFYRDCRVVGAGSEQLEAFRLALSRATARTIATTLALLGVAAPEQM
jgi:arginyl-tRNA synthetase